MEPKEVRRLSVVFALIYFFSTNGLASLPGLAISFLQKDVLLLTASQMAYFGSVTMLGWLVKPLWGMISDTVPIFGYRRKSWLIITALCGAIIWYSLGTIPTASYTWTLLLTLFTASAMCYAFNDVICDALMVETGKPHNLTGKFQSVQWSAVYTASILVGVSSGFVAEHLSYQTIFRVNALFPLIVLFFVLFYVKEARSAGPRREQARAGMVALKEALRDRRLLAIAFFLFFWTFSPSYGTPFFFFTVDTLHFGKVYLGVAGTVGAVGALLGALAFGRYETRFNAKNMLRLMIVAGVVMTLADFIYFSPLAGYPILIRGYNLTAVLIGGALSGFVGIALLNLGAKICPKYGEGTTFAALASFWNIGLMASGALGGLMFDLIGLKPLIVVSAAFTAAAWFLLPMLKLEK